MTALWGRRAHSCPLCDGEAYAGRRLLVLAGKTKGAHYRALLAGWTDQVTVVDPSTVVTIDERGDEVVARLDSVRRSHAGPAGRLRGRDGVDPPWSLPGQGRTTHPRLWAAGDCAWRAGDSAPGGQVIAAMAAASRAAARIVFDRLGVQLPDPPPVQSPRTAAVAGQRSYYRSRRAA